MELKSTKALVLLFVVVCAAQTFGQKWQRVDSVFSPTGVVTESFSCPFFCDIDKDGDPDLFLGSTGNRVLFFENNSYGSVQSFRNDTVLLSSIYANGYQYTNADYPFLADLDADGDLDLLIGGYNGILYYKNIGDSLVPEWQQNTTLFAGVNAQIGTDPKPIMGDIDGDGDLDLIVGIGESLMGGPTAGITMAFRNTGTNREPAFTYDNTLTIGIGDAGYNAYPTLADLDKDGDLDMLMGKDQATFVYYKNVGNRTTPTWSTTTSLFSGVENSRYWKDPVLFDYDKDGDYDLIYGTDSGLLYYYTNTGTPTAPAFAYDAAKFRIIKSENNAATVSIADYDKDGDYDFISGNWLGTVQFYKNEGTKNTPLFKLTPTVFSTLDFGSYSCPVFVDIDGDGDQDIVGGEMNGTVTLYVNNNNATFTKNTAMFSMVNTSGFSAPAFGDIDGDGDLDLLVGAENAANTKFFINTGKNVFVQNDNMFSGVTFYSRAVPAFSDIDGDGDLDLVMGRNFGEVACYENTGSRLAPVWTPNDSLAAELAAKQNTVCGFADLDADGKRDAIVGEYDGTFTFYKNLFAFVGNEQVRSQHPESFALLQNYPNPFNPSTQITYSVPTHGHVQLTVFDALGREVERLVNAEQAAGTHTITFNGKNLSSGIYFYTLRTGNLVETNKMLLVK